MSAQQIRCQWSHERGFTLIELMVAMTVGMILMMALSAIFFESLRNADIMLSQARLNRQAREMFDMMALGGHRIGVNVKTGTAGAISDATADVDYNYVFGLRGRQHTNAVPSAARTGWNAPSTLMAVDTAGNKLYQAALYPNAATTPKAIDPRAILYSDSIPNVSVDCTGTSQPIADCSSNTSLSVQGFLRMDSSDMNYDNGAGTNITGVVFDLFNAENIRNGTTASGVASDEMFSVYWTAFVSIIDNPP